MKRIQSLLLTMLSLLLAFAAWSLPFSQVIDGLGYDLMLSSTRILQQDSKIVIVGIDDESLDRYREPLVMWHEQLAEVISSASENGARSIGLDLIPAVSMERIAPELDRKLMQAIRFATHQETKVFLGFSAGQHGMMPENKFSVLASGLGYLNFFPDQDGTVRRQIVSLQSQQGKTAFSLAFLLAASPDLKAPEVYNNTYVDYRHTPGRTVSLAHVLQLAANHDKLALRDLFNAKIVLIGVTSPKMPDIRPIPTSLDIGEHGFIPGVHIHAFMIQSLINGALRKDVPKPFNVLLLIVLGGITSFCILKWPPRKSVLFLAGLVLLTVIVGYAIFHSGFVLSASSVLFGVLVPALAGLFFRVSHEYQLTDSMSRFFRTYVNLDRLEDIMKNPQTRLQQEKQLGNAIERKELFLCYQPKIDVKNGAIVGMEALVRWIRPNGDFVSPGHFIPLAEETGLITKLTELVVDRACLFAHTLEKSRTAGQPIIPRISINLSARDLERSDLVQYLQQATSRHGIAPRQIDLEITESSLIQDMDTAIKKISTLREAGFSISIDDFGTGQSSLGYITQIPFDNLKVDKSLIDNIATERRAYAVVSAIIAMSKSLGSKVVAEGVEDAQQLDQLSILDCDQIQGYIFSRPLDENKALEMISSGKIFTTN